MIRERIETRLGKDGSLNVTGLGLPPCAEVEVTILVHESPAPGEYPLRGIPCRYDDPFESVAEDEWEAARDLSLAWGR